MAQVKPILIVALNPSIDAEWRVDDVLWDEKNNVLSERRWAGGKGINVARWLKHLGTRPRLILPLGGESGSELAGHLQGESLDATIVRLRESTRVNVIVTTGAGRQMRFNPLGPMISAAEWNRVFKAVKAQLGESRLLVLSGSLPRGLPASTYADLIRLAHRSGVRTILDCDGPALVAAAKAKPFLVKPNAHELAKWWRRKLTSEDAVKCAATALSNVTKGWVLISRGAKRGLLLNSGLDYTRFAAPAAVKAKNTVGAGDAMLAAVTTQIALGKSPSDWLRKGLETGSVATQVEAGRVGA